MGTTAEKLTYLNTTKGKIKDSINLTGAGITTEPFRQYAVKLKDAYVDIINNGTETLYNNFPKVSGSGTDLSLQNTYEAPMQSTLKGNTSQVQLSGKNLFNPVITNNGTDIYTSNCTASVSNGVISLTATANGRIDFGSGRSAGGTYQDDRGVLIAVEPNTTYQISLSNQTFQRTYINKWDSSKVSLGGNSLYLPNTSYTTDEDTYYISLDLVYANAVSGTTYSTTVQVEKGSTPTSYEEYCGGTPSPNPSYPQDIHNVSGNNSVVVCGKNRYGITSVYGYTYSSGLPSTQTANMIINSYDLNNISFTANNNNQYLIALLPTYQLQPNTSYKVSYSRTNTLVSGSNARRYIYSIDENNNYALLDQKLSNDSGNVDFEFTTASTGKIALAFGFNNNSLGSSSVVNNLMVRLATDDNTYEAYNGNVYPINLPVENLFNKNDTNIIDNYYLLSDDTTYGSTNFYITDYIVIQPNTTYTLSPYRNYSAYECFYDKDKTFISSIKIGDITPSFTTPSNCKYIRLSIRKYDVDEEQLEKGSKPNTYTPYGTTPIELNKIGTYQDYFYKEDGKWYLHKETGIIVLNGSEEWNIANNVFYANVFTNRLAISGQTIPTYSDNYIFFGNVANTSGLTTNYNYAVQNNLTQRILIRDERYTTTTNYSTWLSTHNTNVYYVLATATNTEITDTTLIEQLEAIKNANSRNGTTNINQENNDLSFIITASALEKE